MFAKVWRSAVSGRVTIPMRMGYDPRCVMLEKGARFVKPEAERVPTRQIGLGPGRVVANWTRSSFSMFSMSERVMITFYDGKIFPVRKRYLCLGVVLNDSKDFFRLKAMRPSSDPEIEGGNVRRWFSWRCYNINQGVKSVENPLASIQ